MNGYEPSVPRAALALAAAAMTIITMGALVVLPAQIESAGADAPTLAAAKAVPRIEVAASPTRVDVPVEDRQVLAHPGRTTLEMQASRGSRHPLSSRTRTNF